MVRRNRAILLTATVLFAVGFAHGWRASLGYASDGFEFALWAVFPLLFLVPPVKFINRRFPARSVRISFALFVGLILLAGVATHVEGIVSEPAGTTVRTESLLFVTFLQFWLMVLGFGLTYIIGTIVASRHARKSSDRDTAQQADEADVE